MGTTLQVAAEKECKVGVHTLITNDEFVENVRPSIEATLLEAWQRLPNARPEIEADRTRRADFPRLQYGTIFITVRAEVLLMNAATVNGVGRTTRMHTDHELCWRR